jgi:hypothetical protein
MRQHGIEGKLRGRKKRRTIPRLSRLPLGSRIPNLEQHEGGRIDLPTRCRARASEARPKLPAIDARTREANREP